MKRYKLIPLFIIVFCLGLVGCGNKNKTGNRNSQTEQSMVDSIAAQNEATAETTTEMTTETITEEVTSETTSEIIIYEEITTEFQINEEEFTGEPDPTVDIDMTVMPANMVFSQVSHIMRDPDSYLGKTMKIQGPYYALYYDVTGNYYHYVIITDAQACCESGFEFIWDEGAHTYPDEYPKDDQEIVISGELKCYEEEDYIYYYLDVDGYTVVE
ncbi:MAG: hypothetical protein E7258_06215 [Lachnospiraceae bacterium]|nr:hypothetical protein [Lachnospiraceae bacterium]